MKITNREIVYKGFFNLEKITLEDEGETLAREIYRNGDAVAALVFDTDKQQYLLAEQYRIASDKKIVEVVAGLLDKENEDPEKAICREIEEEIGYKVDMLEPVSSFFTSPGACAEKLHLFYAEVSKKTGEGGGLASEHENIKTVAFTREELFSTNFEDAKTLIAVLWLRSRANS